MCCPIVTRHLKVNADSTVAINRYPDSRWTVHDVSRTLYSVFNNCLREEFFDRYNQSSAHLPPELMVQAFQYLAFADRISAAHVCTRRRGVLLGTSSLWTDVDEDNMHCFAQQLRYSRDLPVRMTLTLESRTWHDYLPLLSATMHRLTYLFIGLLEDEPADAVVQTLASVLMQPAPLLQTFVFEALYYRDPANLISSLFANNAPRLRSIKFHGPPHLLSKSGVALQSLTSLLLCNDNGSQFSLASSTVIYRFSPNFSGRPSNFMANRIGPIGGKHPLLSLAVWTSLSWSQKPPWERDLLVHWLVSPTLLLTRFRYCLQIGT